MYNFTCEGKVHESSKLQQQELLWLVLIDSYRWRWGGAVELTALLPMTPIPCSGWSLLGCPHLMQQALLAHSLLQCKIRCKDTCRQRVGEVKKWTQCGGEVCGRLTHSEPCQSEATMRECGNETVKVVMLLLLDLKTWRGLAPCCLDFY